MTSTTRKQIKALEKLRLPELQARFAEVTGEETRAPNRRFLIRRIAEVLEARESDVAAEPTPDDTAQDETTPAPAAAASADAPDAGNAGEGATESADGGAEERRLSKLSVPELQTLYLEVVGRPTGSSHKRYLIWKVRQAQKGRIPVGPRGSRRADGEVVDFKVLPLRMEADLVTRLDEARERLGLKSRMELFRRALHAFLGEQGEAEIAALFAAEA